MEVDKSQDLQWSCRRANGVVLVQIQRPENRESQWWCSNLKACRLKTQKSQCFCLSQKAGKSWYFSSMAVRWEKFSLNLERVSLLVLVRPSIDWMRPSTIERAVCFTPAPNSNVNFIQNTLQETHRIMSDQISGYLLAKLIRKSNYHSYYMSYLL